MTWKEAFSFRKNLSDIFNQPADDLPPLDGLRALAVLYLIMFHSFFHLQFIVSSNTFFKFIASFPACLTWVWHGDKGVDMFFILSGFLITVTLMKEYSAKNHINFKRFYLKRWLRLTPLYLAAMIVTAILFNGQNIKYAWANLLYVNNFITFKKMFMMWSWTQAVEMQFYILCPLFLLFIIFRSRYKWQVLLVFLLASFAVRAFVILTDDSILQSNMPELIFPRLKNFNPSYYDLTYFKLHTRFGPIICGIFAAHLHVCHTDGLKRFFSKQNTGLVNVIIVCVLAFILLLLMVPYYHPDFKASRTFKFCYLIAGRSMFSMGVAFIMLASLYANGIGKLIGNFLSLKIWQPLARLSYSIYLFHLLIGATLYFILLRIFGEITSLDILYTFAAALLVTVVTFVFSVFAYAGIERPFVKLREMF